VPGMLRHDNHHTVLITGFGPFGGRADNPSGELARRLDGATVGGAAVVGRVFETSTDTVGADLSDALAELAPDLLVCLGVAPGASALTLERTAVNIRDFPFPDQAGVMVTGQPVVTGGRDRVLSGLPLATIQRRWSEDGVPCEMSNSAGTYLCNQLFYLACLAGRDRGIPAGFVHVPDTPESAAAAGKPGREPGPAMSLDLMSQALRSAIEVCLRVPTTPLGSPAG